jgi:hypothetical protein
MSWGAVSNDMSGCAGLTLPDHAASQWLARRPAESQSHAFSLLQIHLTFQMLHAA